MSRIGKKPVAVPSGVKVNHDQNTRTVGVEGPKGKLSFQYRPEVAVAWNEDAKEIVCTIPENRMDDGQTKAYWGTTRAQIAVMIDGVTKGYEKKLEITGVGWNARQQGPKVVLTVGYANTIELPVPQGVNVVIEGSTITVSGHDKQKVGQFAAEIRDTRRPEPYNAKGVKYANEVIIRKQGKAFGA